MPNKKPYSRVIIVAPLSSLSLRTRLYKLAISLNDMEQNIAHIGWERLPNERDENRLNFNIGKRIILKGGGYSIGSRKHLYMLWMIKLFFVGFTIKKDEIVWALGFESAFPLLFARWIKGYKLYFDDADRFSMLVKNRFIRHIIRVLEIFTSHNVTSHIIPSLNRYKFKSRNFCLIPNTPSKVSLDKAKEIFNKKEWKQASLVININGWLSLSRGLGNILKIRDLMKDENICFIMSGKLDCDEAILLSKKPNVQYLGVVSNEEALASYYASDFVFTYYDPSSEINRYAASNKWGDALKTGVGIIVNKEVVSSKELIELDVAIGFDYHDIDGLMAYLKSIIHDKDNSLFVLKNNAKQLGNEYIYFDSNIKKVLLSN